MLGKVCRAIHNRTVQALVQKLFGGRNSYHKTKPIAIEKKKRTSFTQDLTGSLNMLMQCLGYGVCYKWKNRKL